MERSLSLLLPVRDAQATLSETVHRILEVASELTDWFEVILIDDGSTDATSEVVAELKRDYPQVRDVRSGRVRGLQESLRTGLRMCRGQIVLYGAPGRQLAIEELPNAWKSAQADNTLPPECAYRMIDRRKPPPSHGPSRPGMPNFLARVREFARGE